MYDFQKRIVVADDNANVCAVSAALKGAGYGVETAADGVQALVLMSSREAHPGTVPGMKHDFLSTATLLGIAATLRKPFPADKLLATVQQVLQPG